MGLVAPLEVCSSLSCLGCLYHAFASSFFFFPLFSFSYKARKGQQPKESVSSLCCCAVPQNLTGRQKSEAGPGACAAQHSARTDIMSNSSIYIYMYHYDVSI